MLVMVSLPIRERDLHETDDAQLVRSKKTAIMGEHDRKHFPSNYFHITLHPASRVLCISKFIHLPAKLYVGGKCSDIVSY